MVQLLLASQSPRRRALLTLAGYPFAVTAADVDEESVTAPDPAQNALWTALLKADWFLQQGKQSAEQTFMITADTTVALEERLLGKPSDGHEATAMLRTLRGRTHQVHTAVALVNLRSGELITGIHSAAVTMRSYGEKEIRRYVESGDPLDKAGAYAIQHAEFAPVRELSGCYLGVVGLSVCHLLQLFSVRGLQPKIDLAALHLAHNGYRCPLLDNAARKLGK